MKDRIKRIMESMHMTQQVFAEFIGTTPATLSGIFNDRTRPTLNIVESIKKKIPNINTDWLMFGSGSMFLSDATPSTPSEETASSVHQSLFPQETDLNFEQPSSPQQPPTPLQGISAVRNYNSVKGTHQDIHREETKFIDKRPRHVTEIRVYYDDQTWESFVPSKK